MKNRYAIIGERSEPPLDKLGGETFIASCMLVCLSIYAYNNNVASNEVATQVCLIENCYIYVLCVIGEQLKN